MGDTGIDEWQCRFLPRDECPVPGTRPENPSLGSATAYCAHVNFRHLFRYRSGRFHATRTDKARYARRRDHCRTSDTKGFGNRTAHIRVRLLLREAGETDLAECLQA